MRHLKQGTLIFYRKLGHWLARQMAATMKEALLPQAHRSFPTLPSPRCIHLPRAGVPIRWGFLPGKSLS